MAGSTRADRSIDVLGRKIIEDRNILNPGFVESSGNFTKENLMRRFAVATGMVLLLASAVLAADLTGK
jgi:hypothetical protein